MAPPAPARRQSDARSPRAGWTFVDADDYHSPDAVAKMARRRAALRRRSRAVATRPARRRSRPQSTAASTRRCLFGAAARVSRRRFAAPPTVRFVYLQADEATLRRRLRGPRRTFRRPGSLSKASWHARSRPPTLLTIDATGPRGRDRRARSATNSGCEDRRTLARVQARAPDSAGAASSTRSAYSRFGNSPRR